MKTVMTMRHHRLMRKTVSAMSLVALLALASVPVLSGCSNPGAMTCNEYAALTTTDRRNIEADLLEAHDLEKNSFGNIQGIMETLRNYCGVGLMSSETTAKKNGNSSLNDAVDWNAKEW